MHCVTCHWHFRPSQLTLVLALTSDQSVRSHPATIPQTATYTEMCVGRQKTPFISPTLASRVHIWCLANVSGDQEPAISMCVYAVYCCPHGLGRQTVCLVFVTAVLDSAVLFKYCNNPGSWMLMTEIQPVLYSCRIEGVLIFSVQWPVSHQHLNNWEPLLILVKPTQKWVCGPQAFSLNPWGGRKQRTL